MTYDDDDDEPRSAEEMLEAVRKRLADLDERISKIGEDVEDAFAGVRLDIGLMRREMVEVKNALGRVQNRLDYQLTALVLANIASGVGVAALVLGAAHALG